MKDVIRENAEAVASKPEKKKTGVSASAVKQYLQENPDFFDQYPELLGDLHLPSLHNSEHIGALNIRQLGVLRERQRESAQKLREFLTNANENQKLISQSKHYVLALLDSDSPSSLLDNARASLIEEFGVEFAQILPCIEDDEETDYLLVRRFVSDSGQNSECFTGAIREHESQLLFGQGDAESCAVICRKPDEENNLPGLALAVGSSDADFYFQGIGTDILEFLADVAVRSLARYN